MVGLDPQWSSILLINVNRLFNLTKLGWAMLYATVADSTKLLNKFGVKSIPHSSPAILGNDLLIISVLLNSSLNSELAWRSSVH